MQAILMSIQAQHNRNIESGQKKVELRTRAPKLKTPFKVFTYESGKKGRHKIVNEWICNRIDIYPQGKAHGTELAKTACLEPYEVTEYSNGYKKEISALHISSLKIYDKPKELEDFKLPCKQSCLNCKYVKYLDNLCDEQGTYKITKPPQSWCYVEE